MATEDDDPAGDWPQDAVPKTEIDLSPLAGQPDTAPHAVVAELVVAREAAVAKAREEAARLSYVEGQRNATQAFRRVLAERAGLTPPEIQRVVEWAVRYMDAL